MADLGVEFAISGDGILRLEHLFFDLHSGIEDNRASIQRECKLEQWCRSWWRR